MFANLDSFVQSFALAIWPMLADAAVKSLLILAVTWIATSALRSSAAARHFTWMLAVFGILLLPILSALSPAWRILPAWTNPQPERTTLTVPFADNRVPMIAPVVAPPADLSSPQPIIGPHNEGQLQQSTQTSAAQTAARQWWPLRWQTWALAVWACGLIIMLFPITISLLGLWRLGRCTPRNEGTVWSRLLADCTKQLEIRHPITLLRGRRQGMPMTWGIFSTKLLLPAEAEQWSIERRRVVLLHELAHVQRRDFLMQLFARMARAIFWFNPLMWIAAKQIALESEAACDDLVITHQTKASDYAEHLLAVAAGVKDNNLFCSTAVAMAQSSRLKGRLMAILDPNRDRRTPSVAAVVIAGCLFSGGLLPLAMLRAGTDPASPNTSQPPASAKADATKPARVAQSPAAGELSGLVTDEAGNPLAGALVDVWTWCAGNETKTDQQGHFTLTKLDDEPVEIRVSKEGFSPWYNPIEPTGKNSLKVRLSSETYFEGDVTGPAGKPLQDALIRADSGPKSNPGVQITSVWTETRSDEHGHYRLFVAPDQYVIQVHVPKIGAVRTPATQIGDGQVKKVNLKLVPGVRFQAIAIDSKTGKPVSKVQLGSREHKGIEETSGNDGKIAIDGLTAGKFTFNVSAPGYARWWSPQATQPHHRKELRDTLQRNFDDLEFDLTDDMAPVTIELEREVRITGVVHDPDGQPVAGATVAPAHTGTGNSLTGDTRYSVPTSKDGSFEMKLPASGDVKYNLIAHDGAHGQWRKWANGVLDPIQTQPGDEVKNVVIKLTRPATVRGHMKDETGKPLAGRDVRASAADKLENRYYDPTTKTDENGDFELRFIRPGEQFIQAAPFFWTNVPPGGMTLKLREGETNSQQVTLKEGETKVGVQLTAPASTAFPSPEEQLRRILEKAHLPD
jgi:beta-lactamase regulating signal transducer with metallopeptidase domain/protocatechuate 3,4-dioxygenase beta subunit